MSRNRRPERIAGEQETRTEDPYEAEVRMAGAEKSWRVEGRRRESKNARARTLKQEREGEEVRATTLEQEAESKNMRTRTGPREQKSTSKTARTGPQIQSHGERAGRTKESQEGPAREKQGEGRGGPGVVNWRRPAVRQRAARTERRPRRER